MRFGSGMAAALAVALMVGCGDAVAPALDRSSRLRLGALQVEGNTFPETAVNDPRYPIRWSIEPGENVAYAPNAIESPDTVRAGEAFEVAVNTVAPNGCWRAAGMDTARSGRVVEFTPWDEDSGAQVCTQVLAVLRHDVSIVLMEMGEWTLRAKGRLVRRGEPERVVTAERTVVVR